MVRYSGAALGLALGSSKTLRQNDSRSIINVGISLALFVGAGYASHLIHHNLIPKDEISLFYAYEYILNASIVFLLLKMANK